MRLPDLAEIEAHQENEVILKFSRDNGLSISQSEMLFKETMRLLWLMAKHQCDLKENLSADVPAIFTIQKAMDSLDKMWHEYILFTKSYHHFCHHFFGEYFHHIPCSEEEYLAFQARAKLQKEAFVELEREKIATYVEYIHKHLGEETVNRWFFELPQLTKPAHAA